MGFLVTISAFSTAGLAARLLALGMSGKPLHSGLGSSVLWVGAWAAAGWSFASWKERMEKEYVERLQYLVDRKERRDKWDQLYINAVKESGN